MSEAFKNPHAGILTCEICGRGVRSGNEETTAGIAEPQLTGHSACVQRVQRDSNYLKVVRERRVREHKAHLLIRNFWNQTPAERAKRVQQAQKILEISALDQPPTQK